MSSNEFLKNIKKITKNKYAALLSQDDLYSDSVEFVDTGNYLLNAVLSGSIFKGLPSNKIVAFSGEKSTGKTYFLLYIVKKWLEKYEDSVCVYFESEGALTTDLVKSRGIDTERFLVLPVFTIEDFSHQINVFLDDYLKNKSTQNVIFCLDSLGNLPSAKEVANSVEGSDKKDMTRSGVIKSLFRVLTLRLSVAKIPLLVTNHLYANVGGGLYGPTTVQSGGCLVKGTKILMKDYSHKDIDLIQIGDEVKTLSGSNKVTKTFIFDDKDVYRVNFDDGTSIECSGNHRFLVKGEWKSIGELIEENNLNSMDIEVTLFNKNNV